VTELTIDKVLELIAYDESETVEFKESFGDEALETIGAFSNAKGGYLFIGVKDSGEICGLSVGKKTLEDMANRIQDVTDPRLQPSLSVIKHNNKNIAVILVSRGIGIPVSVRGRYFRRTGRTNQRMSHDEIMQKMTASTGLSWDAMVEPTSSLEDLDLGQISWFVKIVKEKGRAPIPKEASDQEILRKLKLIRDDTPTRAALLLFGKDPEDYFASAFLKIGRFRSPTHIVDDREVHGTLIDQIDGAMGWFRERLETEFIITGEPQREVKWEYPLEAIREAVANAVCHRDYMGLAHTQIRLYDDHLVIRNMGGLPHALTLDSLFAVHDSVPRNRIIADSFFYAGIIERWGGGTLLMINELKAAGLPPPLFETDVHRFCVKFYRNYFTEEQLKKLGLSERQLKVVAYVKEHGGISNKDYQLVGAVSKSTATRELNELKDKGVFYLEGTRGRGVIYKLKLP